MTAITIADSLCRQDHAPEHHEPLSDPTAAMATLGDLLGRRVTSVEPAGRTTDPGWLINAATVLRRTTVRDLEQLNRFRRGIADPDADDVEDLTEAERKTVLCLLTQLCSSAGQVEP